MVVWFQMIHLISDREQCRGLIDQLCYRQEIPLLIYLNCKAITGVSACLQKSKRLKEGHSDKAQAVFHPWREKQPAEIGLSAMVSWRAFWTRKNKMGLMGPYLSCEGVTQRSKLCLVVGHPKNVYVKKKESLHCFFLNI